MNDFSWFPFSVVSFILIGLTVSLLKLPSIKGHNRIATVFWNLFFSAVLALIFFSSYFPEINSLTIFYGAIWGVGLASITLLQMYALAHVNTHLLFPVTTTISLVITVLIGLLIFSEVISLVQGLGILIAVVSIYLFLYEKGKFRYPSLVLILGIAIVSISVSMKSIEKLAADNVNIYVYQIVQFFSGASFALLVSLFLNRKKHKEIFSLRNIKLGSVIGVFSIFGGWAYLEALIRGPFTLITSLHSMYIVPMTIAGFFVQRKNNSSEDNFDRSYYYCNIFNSRSNLKIKFIVKSEIGFKTSFKLN